MQVIINLVRNSMKALKNTPRKNIEITSEISEQANYIHVYIEDNGPGVPVQLHEKIFEEYFTTNQEGVGLGLDICRVLITQLGGSINLCKHPREGARFLFNLPII